MYMGVGCALTTRCQDQSWGLVILNPGKPIFLTAVSLCCVFDITPSPCEPPVSPWPPLGWYRNPHSHSLPYSSLFPGGNQTCYELFAHLSKWRGDVQEAWGAGRQTLPSARSPHLPPVSSTSTRLEGPNLLCPARLNSF